MIRCVLLVFLSLRLVFAEDPLNPTDLGPVDSAQSDQAPVSVEQQSRYLEAYPGVYSVGSWVYDVTNQTTAATLRQVVPEIFSETFTLSSQDDSPEYWSIAFVKGDDANGGAGALDAPEPSSGGIISDAIKEAMTEELAVQGGEESYEPKDDYLNALFTFPAPILTQNRTTHIRFVEIPDGSGKFTNGTYSYGLTKSSSFGANYNLTGLFLGSQGNLQLSASETTSSIGAASHALRADFTDSSRQGRKVDFYIETSGDGMRDVYLAVGGRSFGHAFNIPPNGVDIASSLSLLPAVRFEANQTMAVCVVVWRPFPIPSDAPYRRKQAALGTGLTGEWIVPEDRSSAQDVKPKVIMRVTDGPSELSSLTREVAISIKVVNVLRVRYKVGLLGQVLSRSPVTSTKMAGTPQMMAVESNIVKLLRCAEILTINDTKQLLVKCVNDSMKQVFDSYVDTSDQALSLNPWLAR